MFSWDADTSSKKLLIEDDCLTVKVKDGSGFKTSIGDMVPSANPLIFIRLSYPATDITFRSSLTMAI